MQRNQNGRNRSLWRRWIGCMGYAAAMRTANTASPTPARRRRTMLRPTAASASMKTGRRCHTCAVTNWPGRHALRSLQVSRNGKMFWS